MSKLDDSEVFFGQKMCINESGLNIGDIDVIMPNWLEDMEKGREIV